MNEVKVYDGSGNLKKVISVDQLNIRSQKQLETISVFSKNTRPGGPSVKLPESEANGGKP